MIVVEAEAKGIVIVKRQVELDFYNTIMVLSNPKENKNLKTVL